MTKQGFAQRQALADLQWVLESPSLITGDEVAESQNLDVARVDVEELLAFLADRQSHRVGRYFESLVLFWLERVRQVQIVASGLQIRDGNRTVGEIDFLFRDEDGRLNHWEASVKFFLHLPNLDGSHFPGPNARDNFERKITKLFEQQLRLSEQYYPNVEVRRAFVKGMIFYRDEIGEPDAFPDRMSSAHLRGGWFRESELERLNTFDEVSGVILEKPYWLACPEPSQTFRIPQLRTKLQQHFEGAAYPVMVSIMSPGGDEVRRLFVVPDSWPNTD